MKGFWEVMSECSEWGSLSVMNPVALVPDRSSNEDNFSYTAIGNQRHRIRSGLTQSLLSFGKKSLNVIMNLCLIVI